MKLKTLLVGAIAGLLLTACGGSETPDNVTKSFVQALADGDCDKAKGMAIEDALLTVETAMENGCEPYATEIKSVECEDEEDETTTCTCIEERGNETENETETETESESETENETTYKYDLTKVEGEWKVSNYEKDINLEDFGGLE